jgi:predicted N-acetyltransferase YhbS
LIGGLNGAEHWKWLYIRQLWVRDDHRGQGLGLKLMRLAESDAVTRGCQGMYIDTFDEKTASFYEHRCGFIRCGEIVNFPPGNAARVYLKKELISPIQTPQH